MVTASRKSTAENVKIFVSSLLDGLNATLFRVFITLPYFLFEILRFPFDLLHSLSLCRGPLLRCWAEIWIKNNLTAIRMRYQLCYAPLYWATLHPTELRFPLQSYVTLYWATLHSSKLWRLLLRHAAYVHVQSCTHVEYMLKSPYMASRACTQENLHTPPPPKKKKLKKIIRVSATIV
jgi:hypothetical protein